MPLALVVLLPLLGALLPPLFARISRDAPAWAAAAVNTAALAVVVGLAPYVVAGMPATADLQWLPQWGLDVALRLDGLALLFSFMILGVGLLVILYARYYLREQDPLGRFFGLLLLFQGAMLGIVIADNLLLLLVFWELTSLSSFLLIAYSFHQPSARHGARMAIAVTGAGGLAMFAGFLLLGHMTGTWRISAIVEMGDQVKADAWYLPTLLLILAGAFTKSAQFPFHFWLPGAMAAPTPVSAYLHSATMVKAGVFLLARLFPVFSGTDSWFFLVGGVGLVTLLYGAYIALLQHDLKGLLAYSTVSHLGLITLLFGLGTPLGAVAGIFHVVNHATFKASLFMAAGIIEHETGTRDMRRINGLWHYMPQTAVLAIVAAAAMAGVPLLNGFLSKEMFFAETVQYPRILPVMATLAGAFAVAYSLRFIHDVFFNGEPVDLPRMPPQEPARWMLIPVEVLVGVCLLIGVAPDLVVKPLLDAASFAALGYLPYYDLALWHGLSLPVLMSAVALGGGTLIYLARYRIFALHALLPTIDGATLFDRTMVATGEGAARLLAWADGGRLRRYLIVLTVSALTLGIAPWLTGGRWMGPVPFTPVDGVSGVAALLLAATALATVRLHGQHAAAVMMLGGVGLVVTLAFVHFSAPDLALTQIVVEVVTAVLMLLAIFFLPGEAPGEEADRAVHWGDALVAALAGLGVAALLLAVLTRPYDTMATYYLNNAKALGGGDNVVNVILVDFRGFDTLGEITVLAVAAVAVYALLHELRLPLPRSDPEGRPWARQRHPLLLAILSRPLLPLTLLVALFILLRGHNAPGGGFIAGLMAAIALILQYLASGIEWTQPRMPLHLHYFRVVGGGLLLAVLVGSGGLLFSAPFLTSGVVHLEAPLIGELELASALLFDIGVFLAVVGVVMLILAHLGHVSRLHIPIPRETPEEER